MLDPEILEIRKNVRLFIEGKISGHELARHTPVVKQEDLFEEVDCENESVRPIPSALYRDKQNKPL